MKRIVAWMILLASIAWAAPPELEWLQTLPGVKKTAIHDWGASGWEGNFEMNGDGFATSEKTRAWMIKKGWTVKDEDRSSAGVISRRLDGVRGKQKFNLTFTQQRGQAGKLNAALITR